MMVVSQENLQLTATFNTQLIDLIAFFQIYWNNSSFRINKLFHECC